MWGNVTWLERAANVIYKVSQLNDICCFLCVILAVAFTLCYKTPYFFN